MAEYEKDGLAKNEKFQGLANNRSCPPETYMQIKSDIEAHDRLSALKCWKCA